MRFEDLFQSIGGTGRAQVEILAVSLFAIEAFIAQVTTYLIFESYNPGTYCERSNSSDGNWTSGYMDGNFTFELNEIPECGAGLIFKEGLTSPATEFMLVDSERYIAKLFATLFFVGFPIGAFVGGQLSDRFGRKKVILSLFVVMSILQSCSAFSPNWQVYMCLRALTGFAAGGCHVANLVIGGEYVGSAWRPLASTRCGWNVGVMGLVFITYYLQWNWRYVALTIGLLPLLAIPVIWFQLPESSRWLMTNGRVEEAFKEVCKIAKKNRRQQPTYETMESIAIAERKNLQAQKSYNVTDLFKRQKYRKRSLIVGYLWCNTALLSYGLKLCITDLTGNIFLNVSIAYAGAFLAKASAIFIPVWIGRRFSYGFYVSLLLVCMFVVVPLQFTSIMETHPLAISFVAVTGAAIVDGSWSILVLLSTELFPTVVRNTAMGYSSTVARIPIIVAPLLTLLSEVHPAIIYSIFIASGLLAVPLSLLLPETKREPLEDVFETKHDIDETV